MSVVNSLHVADGRSQARWMRVLALLLCAAVVTAAAVYQWYERDDTLARSEAGVGMLANSLAQHATDTFEVADVLLTGLATALKASPSRSLDATYQLDASLEEQLRSVPRIRSLVAFDRFGHQFASSQPQVPDWFDVAGSEAFEFHKSNVSGAVRIGAPVVSPSTKNWILTVTRRWVDADGAFAGMVMATIRVDYFADFYRDFDVGGEASVGLMRGDGTLLARFPPQEDRLGHNFSDLPWMRETLGRTAGTVRFVSPIDGVARLHGFMRLDDIPLLMIVGVSRASVLADWLPGCILFMGCTAALGLGVAVSGWRFANKLEARSLSERHWSDLAMTDALTGIRNRRAFDETAGEAWGTAALRQQPLSLIIVDVDYFKSFNDTYGHPAGDAVLRAIGQVLAGMQKRPGEIAARYGGEEFAVLLENAGAASALLVAERIRQSVLHLGIAHAASGALPLVSVSVGLATETFGTGPAGDPGTLEKLIERADRALYRSKLEGRNRVTFQRAPVTVDTAA